MKMIDLKSLDKPHDWLMVEDNLRQCLRCGEIQRIKLKDVTHDWYTTLNGVEGLCKTDG